MPYLEMGVSVIPDHLSTFETGVTMSRKWSTGGGQSHRQAQERRAAVFSSSFVKMADWTIGLLVI